MLAGNRAPTRRGRRRPASNGGGERDAAILRAEAEERERRGWENAAPLEGDRENILCLPLALSVGNISQTGIGAEREKALSLLMGVFPGLASQVVGELLNVARKGYDGLRKRAQNGEAIRVWVSREPDAVCGLYWLMEQLAPIGLETLDVTVVRLPEWEARPDWRVVQYGAGERLSRSALGRWRCWGRNCPQTFFAAWQAVGKNSGGRTQRCAPC